MVIFHSFLMFFVCLPGGICQASRVEVCPGHGLRSLRSISAIGRGRRPAILWDVSLEYVLDLQFISIHSSTYIYIYNSIIYYIILYNLCLDMYIYIYRNDEQWWFNMV